MAQFTARMVHEQGPAPVPSDPMKDRDYSRDPRTVSTVAADEAGAREIFLRDNPGFDFYKNSFQEVADV